MISPEELAALPFFKTFDLPSVEIIARHLEPREYWDGERVFTEGDDASELFFVRRGRVEVLWEISRNRKVILASICAGGIFGEMAVLIESPRSATILVVEDLEVFSLSLPNFYRILKEHPPVGLCLLKAIGRNLSNKLRSLNQHFLFARSSLHSLDSPAAGSGRKKGRNQPATVDPSILESLEPYGKPVTAEAGKVLIHEGGIQHDFYLIQEGIAEVTKSIGSDDRILLVHLGPGNLVGEMSFLDADFRSAEVRAVGPMKLYAFHGNRLRTLGETDSEALNRIYLCIIRHLCANIRSTNLLYVGTKRKLLP